MNEQNILIVRCGEVALKGMNKPYFERMLADRIRTNLKGFDGVDVKRHEGLIFVRADKRLSMDAIIKETTKVFAELGTFDNVNLPSMSVTVPTVVPFTKIEAPTTGNPSSSEITVPVTFVI